ncbi:hypothetical protein X762_31470 [Mesorhizobium sp. LSHC426A00]|nr:hypothetical protein X762_31470 [Mesorhizobium sp. LSHC426A00]
MRIMPWIPVPLLQRFSCSRQRQRRHQPHLKTRFSQAPCYRPVIVPGRLKGADHRAAVRLQHFDQMVVLSTGVEDQKATPALVG